MQNTEVHSLSAILFDIFWTVFFNPFCVKTINCFTFRRSYKTHSNLFWFRAYPQLPVWYMRSASDGIAALKVVSNALCNGVSCTCKINNEFQVHIMQCFPRLGVLTSSSNSKYFRLDQNPCSHMPRVQGWHSTFCILQYYYYFKSKDTYTVGTYG